MYRFASNKGSFDDESENRKITSYAGLIAQNCTAAVLLKDNPIHRLRVLE